MTYFGHETPSGDWAAHDVPDMDLPGQWSHSDFEGGDPDERSYAQRERDAAADAVSLGRIAPCTGYEASDERFQANQIAVRRLEAYDESWLADAVPLRFIAGIDQTEEDFDPALLKPSVLWQIPEPVTIEARNVSMEVMELQTGLPLIPLCLRTLPSEGQE